MKKNFLFLAITCLFGSVTIAQKKDTLTTASGLQYSITKKGTGRLLKSGEVAVWHYTLKLADGTLLDDTRKNNAPLGSKIPSEKMIKGTSEALLLMHVGDRGMFIFPPDLGYGERGADGGGVLPSIPPNATLYFDMELVDIKKAALLDTLEKTIAAKAAENDTVPASAIINLYKKLKQEKKLSDMYTSDNDLNTIGYMLLEELPKEAIRIFILNTEEYPKVSNVWDSLGEGYMNVDDFDKAIQNYEKSLALDPNNKNAVEKIKQMKDLRAKQLKKITKLA